MPIFYDRIADQVEELLPEYYQEEGPRFISFLKSYFEFLEKGQLVYKDAADIDYIGLEDGTVAGEAYNDAGERGNLLQESGTYAPSSITSAKFNYEIDIDSGGAQKTSFEKGEYVVGNTTGALARVDVIGNSSNLYIEQFSETQFDIDETITGQTSGMTAKVAAFTASPLHASNNLLSYADVDKTSGDFLEYFRRDFMPFIDRDVLANKRLLQKHVQDLYLSKGTKESYEFLFRILYGLEAEVVFPGDNVIKPSESEFSEPTVMRLFSTKDLTKYKRGLVKKFVGSTEVSSAYINDASGISGTNDADNGYELELILPYVGSFSVGDTVVLSDRDGLRIDAEATVRGVMSDISTTESSVYVGIEDGTAGDVEDVIRLESATPIHIINEDNSGDKILMEDGDELIFEHALGGEKFQARPIGLETGTGVGVILTEEGGILIDENTDLFPHYTGTQDSITMGGGIYTEMVSSGSLFSESDTFNYNSPKGGEATQSINVIGSIGRGGVTEIVIDDAGSGYSVDDQVVFINTGTEGSGAEAFVDVTDGNIELESATEPGIHHFTGDGTTTVFSGRDNSGVIMGFDPRKVQVFVNGSEIARTTGFTTDQAGTKITFASAPANSSDVEIILDNRGILLEDSLRTEKLRFGEFVETTDIIAKEDDGAIKKISISNAGSEYKTLPKVFMGGYIYYDTLTTGTNFSVGEVVTSTNSKSMIVDEHDLERKRILVHKRSTDAAGVPTGTITGGTSGTVFTITQTNVTAGSGAKLFAFSDDIGSIKKLKIQDPGHKFEDNGIGNYVQHCIIKDVSATPIVNTTVTAALTGATGTIKLFDGDLNLLTITDVKGIFNDGDYVTTSDSKNFYIGKTNPCTARGTLSSTSKLDGNYLDDKGFPSVDSMRIHDNSQYQDYSYKIKVGKSINDYRSLIKSLLSPAGTIFFGEVSIRNQVDGSANVYNVNFDGTNTTRSFIPTLIIGSKIDTADIQLEDGTYSENDQVFSSFEGRIQLETGEGVLTTERFLALSSTTVQDQSSGRPFVIGTDTVEETDRDFFERQLTAEATPKGNRVHKELDIITHYNQHKINYSNLQNTLDVGTKIRGESSNAQGIVMFHNNTSDEPIGNGVIGEAGYVIVHRDIDDTGQPASDFLNTEVIKTTSLASRYFQATSVELHHTPEDIISNSSQSTAITPDTTITSANQKISNGVEGGGDAYAHADFISGFSGRGKVLVASDNSEAYDSEMRQRKVNIVSSPIFTRSVTQRGRTYSAVPRQTRTINTQNTRTAGSNTTANNSNGTALRIDSSLNTTSLVGVSFGHRPAGQRLFESTNFLSERIVTENQEPLIFEPDNGNILGEDFSQGGIILLEDGKQLLFEDATINDETKYFVSEESTQIGSFNIIAENNDRLIDETDSLPLILEDALMIGQKESNQSGPTIGDLGDMMFTENYSMMNKIQLDGGSGISSGDDLLLETGEHCLLESPSEGIRISDISILYTNKFVSNLEQELGRRQSLTHSAVIQSG